jgi:hypothetical protein
MEGQSPKDNGGKIRTLFEDSKIAEASDASTPAGKEGISIVRKVLRLWPYWTIFGLAAILLTLGLRYHDAALAPKAVIQKSETLAALRVGLLKSAESEKRSVMAETYEISRDYAIESRQGAELVEVECNQFAALLRLYPSEDQDRLFREFEELWKKLRQLDEQILDLAVQNTNLKAQALSFGKASQALHRFQMSLSEAIRDVDDAQAIKTASDAQIYLLTIQTLHAPHIAASDTGDMDRIEQTINETEVTILRCMERLSEILPSNKRDDIIRALTAYSDYKAATLMILELSRQNTNVTSLEFSLNRKSRLTAQCDAILTRLQNTVKGRR